MKHECSAPLPPLHSVMDYASFELEQYPVSDSMPASQNSRAHRLAVVCNREKVHLTRRSSNNQPSMVAGYRSKIIDLVKASTHLITQQNSWSNWFYIVKGSVNCRLRGRMWPSLVLRILYPLLHCLRANRVEPFSKQLHRSVCVFFLLLASSVGMEGCRAADTAMTAEARAAALYMKRFDVPEANVDLVWNKWGIFSFMRRGIKYSWEERRKNVGVYTGYAEMYDISKKRYCERNQALVDTLKTVGKRLMVSGACPNWGKVISFTDRSGNSPKLDRWSNEVHAHVMPHSTLGCATHQGPGSAEIPKSEEGFTMYSGYMMACPFNDAVYNEDMLPDKEYDPQNCSFVSLQEKLWLLDPSRPVGGKPYTRYAFHGKGGHKGYDVEGNSKHVGCPPYAPPKLTSFMKNDSWIEDLFDCSRLSNCTNHCWPYKDGSACFRGLPAVYNTRTKECLILGYHTQYYLQHECAAYTTSDVNKFYCVKPVKRAATSHLVYLNAHIRPDYNEKCPPKEPLLKTKWGTISKGKYCEELPIAAVKQGVTAEECGIAVFENSSSDDTSVVLPGMHWGTLASTDCPGMAASCRSTARGRCTLYKQVPLCLIEDPNSISFTSLSSVDPAIARTPPDIGYLPVNPCAKTNCSGHGKCDPNTGQCMCDQCYEGKDCQNSILDCCSAAKPCAHNGMCIDKKCECQEGWTGPDCKTPKPDKCKNSSCGSDGTCDPNTGKCICNNPCIQGTNCDIHVKGCCSGDTDCNAPSGTCHLDSHTCVCQNGWEGSMCETQKPSCDSVICPVHSSCNSSTLQCVCELCYEGEACDRKIDNCCVTDLDCNANQTCHTRLHKCLCKEGLTGPNCESSASNCTPESCRNGGICDTNTGECLCDECHAGPECDIVIPSCCKDDSDCNVSRETCEFATHTCICAPGFTGSNCESFSDKVCGSWCVPPDHLIENPDCDTIDCPQACCNAIRSCNSDNTDTCYEDSMKEKHAECCIRKSEKGSNIAVYAAIGGVALLLLLGLTGGYAYMRSRKGKQQKGDLDSFEFEDEVQREDSDHDEEAIEVSLEDFRAHPDDDVNLKKKILSTTWEA